MSGGGLGAVAIAERIIDIQGGLGAPERLVCGVCGRRFGEPVVGAWAVVDELTGYVELCPECLEALGEVEGVLVGEVQPEVEGDACAVS